MGANKYYVLSALGNLVLLKRRLLRILRIFFIQNLTDTYFPEECQGLEGKWRSSAVLKVILWVLPMGHGTIFFLNRIPLANLHSIISSRC